MSSGTGASRPEPCREEIVDVDGQRVPVRVQGGDEWSDADRGHFAEVVRAAVQKFRRNVTLVPLPQQPQISAVLADHVPDFMIRRRAAYAVRRMLRAQLVTIPADHSGGEHLLARHVDAFNAARRDERYPGRLEFANDYGTDWLPPGQWLLATEWCAQNHHFQTAGDPCWCRSDNCAYCARCGVESHD